MSSEFTKLVKSPIDGEQRKLYRMRWVVLACFCGLTFSSASLWITFAPISLLCLEFFNQTSLFSIDALSLLYMIAYIPGIWVAAWFLGWKGMRYGLLVGGLLTTVGAWLRYIGVLGFMPVDGRYPTVLIGQILAAIAQTFILQVPPLLSNNWFGPNERSLATSIGALCNELGVAAGFLISSNMVKTQEDIPWLLLVYAGICTVFFIAALIAIRDKPPTPPSEAAAQRETSHMTVVQSIRGVLHRDFILLFFFFGLLMGIYYGLGTVIASALEPFGYTSHESGMIGFLMTIAGSAGGIATGIINDKLKKYKYMINVIAVGCCGALVWMALIAEPKDYIGLCIASSVFGFFVTAATPASFEAGAEYAFPVPEDFSGGLLMMSAQVFGILLLVVMNQLIRIGKNMGAIWLGVGAAGAAILISLFLSTYYKRMAMEKLGIVDPLHQAEPNDIFLPNDSSSTTYASATDESPGPTPRSEIVVDIQARPDSPLLPNLRFHSAPTTPTSLRKLLSKDVAPIHMRVSHSSPPSPVTPR